MPEPRPRHSAPSLASHAGQCVPAFLDALGETRFRLGRRPLQDGQGRGVLQGRRRRRSLAGVVAGEADGNAQQGIFTADTLAVLFLHADGKSRQRGRTVLRRQFHLLEQHRRVALEIALDISGLITMVAQTPDKDAETVEIPWLFAVGGGGPQPDLLFQIAVLNFAEREIADDPLAFGVLRYVVGDRHGDEAREGPTGLAGGSADEAPAIGAGRQFLGRKFLGVGVGFVALGLGEFQPVGWRSGWLRHGRRRNRRLLHFLDRKSLGLLGSGWDQGLARRVGTRQHDGLQHVKLLVFLKLQETGGGKHGLGDRKSTRLNSSHSLGWQSGGARVQLAQRVHVAGGEQLALIGPPLGAAGGPYAEETAAGLEDCQTVAMLNGGDGGRLKGNVAADLEDGGTYEGFADPPSPSRGN